MTLRRVIKDAAGVDLSQCHACLDCETPFHEEQDVLLGDLVQMVLMNDEEALTCRTLWSDLVLEAARSACSRGLDLYAVMLALRKEAGRRGLHD